MQTFICHDERSSYYISSSIWEEPTTYSAGFPAASVWKTAENCINSIDCHGLVAVTWPSWRSNMGWGGGAGTASEECRLEWFQVRRSYWELHTVVLSSTHHLSDVTPKHWAKEGFPGEVRATCPVWRRLTSQMTWSFVKWRRTRGLRLATILNSKVINSPKWQPVLAVLLAKQKTDAYKGYPTTAAEN